MIPEHFPITVCDLLHSSQWLVDRLSPKTLSSDVSRCTNLKLNFYRATLPQSAVMPQYNVGCRSVGPSVCLSVTFR